MFHALITRAVLSAPFLLASIVAIGAYVPGSMCENIIRGRYYVRSNNCLCLDDRNNRGCALYGPNCTGSFVRDCWDIGYGSGTGLCFEDSDSDPCDGIGCEWVKHYRCQQI
jgi:hypothetical protein